MKPSTLLVAGGLALASGNLLAYQILESRFHVEVAPDKYVDQLVLRCEDGRHVTVPWQSKLAESCGEDLMGNVTIPPAKADSAPIDEQQKQAMLEQLRAQYGNISEKQVEFISGPSGLSTRFKPPIVEVLKKYESCRKASKDKSYCAGERDKALARLADPKPAPAAAQTPAAAQAPAAAQTPAAARAPEPTEAAPRESPAAASPPETPNRAVSPAPARQEATVQAAASTAAPTEATPRSAQAETAALAAAEPPPAQPSEADARAAAEQKINQNYMACMRAKPKFECDQTRTKALAVLDKPKTQKRQQRKAAAAAAEPEAQR
jgi:hypothetical protein